TFITRNYCRSVDVEALRRAFEKLRSAVQKDMDWLYDTRCERCGGKATSGYTVYSQVFQCPKCLEKVALYDCEVVESQTRAGKVKQASACPHCFRKGHTEIIRSQSKKFGYVPVSVRYVCRNGCKPPRASRRHNDPDTLKTEYFAKYDLAKLAEIGATPIPY